MPLPAPLPPPHANARPQGGERPRQPQRHTAGWPSPPPAGAAVRARRSSPQSRARCASTRPRTPARRQDGRRPQKHDHVHHGRAGHRTPPSASASVIPPTPPEAMQTKGATGAPTSTGASASRYARGGPGLSDDSGRESRAGNSPAYTPAAPETQRARSNMVPAGLCPRVAPPTTASPPTR